MANGHKPPPDHQRCLYLGHLGLILPVSNFGNRPFAVSNVADPPPQVILGTACSKCNACKKKPVHSNVQYGIAFLSIHRWYKYLIMKRPVHKVFLL